MVKPKQKAVIQWGLGFKATDLGNISNIPEVLHTKVTQLTDPGSTCQWIPTYPTDRGSRWRWGGWGGGSHSTTGESALVPPKDVYCSSPSTLHFEGLVCLQMAQQASAWSETAANLHTDEVLNSWCGQNTLELSPVTTVEMVGAPPLLFPITILSNGVVTVESVRFLGVISQDLKSSTINSKGPAEDALPLCRWPPDDLNLVHNGHNLYSFIPSGGRDRTRYASTARPKGYLHYFSLLTLIHRSLY